MAENKTSRPKARLPRGFRDRGVAEISAERACLDTIRRVYESYGFEPLETPAFEYTDALGKFLPDLDRPNEGVFFADRRRRPVAFAAYDLTAPLARYVAENFQNLPKPFRRYQVGPVWRNEKPGPGRFREFTQFDADTVGSASPAADAELLMMVCDTLEKLGLKRGEYVVKMNSRKLLDLVLDAAWVDASRRSAVLRAIDKFDRLGEQGVRLLLGAGRKDESGDFTHGVGLDPEQISHVMDLLTGAREYETTLPIHDLNEIAEILRDRGYANDRVRIDTSIIRGLDYYTGAVFRSAVDISSDKRSGRYDCVWLCRGRRTLRRSRLALHRTRSAGDRYFHRCESPNYCAQDPQSSAAHPACGCASAERCAIELPHGVRTAQRGNSCRNLCRDKAVRRPAQICRPAWRGRCRDRGSDERANGKVTLKDLALGAELAKSIEGRAEWVANRPAQKTVARERLVEEVRAMLARTRPEPASE